MTTNATPRRCAMPRVREIIDYCATPDNDAAFRLRYAAAADAFDATLPLCLSRQALIFLSDF